MFVCMSIDFGLRFTSITADDSLIKEQQTPSSITMFIFLYKNNPQVVENQTDVHQFRTVCSHVLQKSKTASVSTLQHPVSIVLQRHCSVRLSTFLERIILMA